MMTKKNTYANIIYNTGKNNSILIQLFHPDLHVLCLCSVLLLRHFADMSMPKHTISLKIFFTNEQVNKQTSKQMNNDSNKITIKNGL